MTKQEFIERTGASVTDAEYKEIEMIYLEAGETMDKDTFCREWMDCGDSPLFHIFYDRAIKMNDRAEVAESKIKQVAEFLIKKSDENADSEEYDVAVELIGRKKSVMFKVVEQIELNADDIEYIKENLK